MEKINHLKKDRKKKHQKKKKKIDKVPTLFPELFITAKISLNQTFIQISIPPKYEYQSSKYSLHKHSLVFMITYIFKNEESRLI